MSKRGFVRSVRTAPPTVPPVRVAVAPPLALPEREPRNIALMIAVPALLVGIIGTLVGRAGKAASHLPATARRRPRRGAARRPGAAARSAVRAR